MTLKSDRRQVGKRSPDSKISVGPLCQSNASVQVCKIKVGLADDHGDFHYTDSISVCNALLEREDVFVTLRTQKCVFIS